MRRPLFTSGLPQIPPNDGATFTTIMDLTSLSAELQSYTRFVTLYAANQRYNAVDTIQVIDGNALTIVNAALPIGEMAGGPVKILDRYPVRGDVKLLAVNDNGTNSVAVIWGYFELEAASDVDAATRPFLPSALVSPFNYEPSTAPSDNIPVQVHLLTTDYYDLVFLDAIALQTSETQSGITINLSDGSDSIALKAAALGQIPVRVFDGIPLMALSTNSTPGIAINSLDSPFDGVITAWGTFTRET